jgi:hypothetical protein
MLLRKLICSSSLLFMKNLLIVSCVALLFGSVMIRQETRNTAAQGLDFKCSNDFPIISILFLAFLSFKFYVRIV